MSEHTPGPWTVCGANDGKCKCRMIWSGDGEGCVAVAHGNHWKETIGDPWPNDDFADANARLIAAAPELLAACKKLVDWAIEIDVENADDTDYSCSRSWDALVREGAASQQILNAQAAIAEAEKSSTGSG